MNKGNYQFIYGVKKGQAGIKRVECLGCRGTDLTLYVVVGGYACKACVKLYERTKRVDKKIKVGGG